MHGAPSPAGSRRERSCKTEQTGNTKPEKHCNTKENRKIELLLLRKNLFSRHRRQKLKASNTATDNHQATERPPEIAQSPHKQQNPIGFSHHIPHFCAKISEIIANIPHQRTLARIFLIFLPVFSLSNRSSVYLHRSTVVPLEYLLRTSTEVLRITAAVK